MSKNNPNKTPAPLVDPADREAEFIRAFEALCKKYGYQMAPEIFVIPTNHGTFELSVRLVIKPA
jgi:hypothetical protein